MQIGDQDPRVEHPMIGRGMKMKRRPPCGFTHLCKTAESESRVASKATWFFIHRLCGDSTGATRSRRKLTEGTVGGEVQIALHQRTQPTAHTLQFRDPNTSEFRTAEPEITETEREVRVGWAEFR
jgi:hypothetical protein